MNPYIDMVGRKLILFKAHGAIEAQDRIWFYPIFLVLCVIGIMTSCISCLLIMTRNKAGTERGVLDSVLLWLFICELIRNSNLAIAVFLEREGFAWITYTVMCTTPIISYGCVTSISFWILYMMKYRKPYMISRMRLIIYVVTPGILLGIAFNVLRLIMTSDQSVETSVAAASGTSEGETVNDKNTPLQWMYLAMNVALLALIFIQTISSLWIVHLLKSLRLDLVSRIVNYPVFVVARKFIYFPLVGILIGTLPVVYEFITAGKQHSHDSTYHPSGMGLTDNPTRGSVDLLIAKWLFTPLLGIGYFFAYCSSRKGTFTAIIWYFKAFFPWCFGKELPPWDPSCERSNRHAAIPHDIVMSTPAMANTTGSGSSNSGYIGKATDTRNRKGDPYIIASGLQNCVRDSISRFSHSQPREDDRRSSVDTIEGGGLGARYSIATLNAMKQYMDSSHVPILRHDFIVGGSASSDGGSFYTPSSGSNSISSQSQSSSNVAHNPLIGRSRTSSAFSDRYSRSTYGGGGIGGTFMSEGPSGGKGDQYTGPGTNMYMPEIIEEGSIVSNIHTCNNSMLYGGGDLNTSNGNSVIDYTYECGDRANYSISSVHSLSLFGRSSTASTASTASTCVVDVIDTNTILKQQSSSIATSTASNPLQLHTSEQFFAQENLWIDDMAIDECMDILIRRTLVMEQIEKEESQKQGQGREQADYILSATSATTSSAAATAAVSKPGHEAHDEL